MIDQAAVLHSKRGGIKRRHAAWATFFLAPWGVGMLVFVLGPLLGSLYLSFTDYSLLSPPKWVGLHNYALMPHDPKLWQALQVTFGYVLIGVPLELIFALLVAVALNRGTRTMDLYRSVFYLPSLFGGSVAVAVLWRQMFGGQGLINQLLGLVGIKGQPWISQPSTSLMTLIVLEIWQFGAPMVIFLAGLRQIPRTYYEAAEVDGASKMRRFVYITLPLLTPIIFFNLVLRIIGSFQAFTPAYIISNGDGGPVDSTLFYTLYLYQEAFTGYRMGYASALGWLLVAIIAIFTAINFILSRKWVVYES